MMTSSRRHSGFFREVRLDEMIGLLEDLTTYFAQPSEDEEMSKIILIIHCRLHCQVYKCSETCSRTFQLIDRLPILLFNSKVMKINKSF